MERLSPLAWVAIGIIVLIAVLVNVWMITLFRDKDTRSHQLTRRMPKRGPSMQDMQKFVRVVRNPFYEEQEQLEQLSTLVKNLDQTQDDPPKQP